MPADEAAGEVWYLGAPLVIGDQLFVLVEEKGEIRLDVRAAADGRLLWSQPLAELDEEQQADRPETQVRRFSGLSPAFAEGVLVCPTGAGTAIAVDLATRTLLWAYTYAVAGGDDDAARAAGRGLLGGINRRNVIVNGVPLGGQSANPGGWRDVCPILAEGCVLLTPSESDALHCLDLRSGSLRWSVPRGDGLCVAGVVDGRAVVVGHHSVDSLSMKDGTTAWRKPLGFSPATVSGRGIVTARRLFLPLDTPEVVEIDLGDGSIAGRSPARGGVIPGNLLAYRGEVISQGVDSLDVFHQVVPLEAQIETAANGPPDPWTLMWRGQLDLDRGRMADGLRAIAAARRAEPQRIPAELVADALLFGMRRDFAAAAPLWREIVDMAGPVPHSKALLSIAIDNQLASGALAEAWRACRGLLDLPPADESDDDWMVENVADPPSPAGCRAGSATFSSGLRPRCAGRSTHSSLRRSRLPVGSMASTGWLRSSASRRCFAGTRAAPRPASECSRCSARDRPPGRRLAMRRDRQLSAATCCGCARRRLRLGRACRPSRGHRCRMPPGRWAG
jgi:hypothetical protein